MFGCRPAGALGQCPGERGDATTFRGVYQDRQRCEPRRVTKKAFRDPLLVAAFGWLLQKAVSAEINHRSTNLGLIPTAKMDERDIDQMRIPELRQFIRSNGLNTNGCLKKPDLQDRAHAVNAPRASIPHNTHADWQLPPNLKGEVVRVMRVAAKHQQIFTGFDRSRDINNPMDGVEFDTLVETTGEEVRVKLGCFSPLSDRDELAIHSFVKTAIAAGHADGRGGPDLAPYQAEKKAADAAKASEAKAAKAAAAKAKASAAAAKKTEADAAKNAAAEAKAAAKPKPAKKLGALKRGRDDDLAGRGNPPRGPRPTQWKETMAAHCASLGMRPAEPSSSSGIANHPHARQSGAAFDPTNPRFMDAQMEVLSNNFDSTSVVQMMLQHLPEEVVQMLAQPEERSDHAIVQQLIVDEQPQEQLAPTPFVSASSMAGFVTTAQYGKRLQDAKLIERADAKEEGQHVFHIIAASNGGPNHVDNYLYALGGSFNMAIGNRFDHVNCYLAGKAKARKAVAVSMEVAADPSLHAHIRVGAGGKRTTYSEGVHKGASADMLYAQGEALFRDLRKLARDKAKLNSS